MNGEEAKSTTREQHHMQGYNATRKLEEEGIDGVQGALSSLRSLIVLVEEGPGPSPDRPKEEKDEPHLTPSLSVYLQGHPEEIIQLNQRLIDLSIKISESINQLRSLLF